jgi:ankyrin repeat protein
MLQPEVLQEEDCNKALFSLVGDEEFDLTEIESLLSNGADANSSDDNGKSLLLKVLQEQLGGYIDLVELLLEYGATIDDKSLLDLDVEIPDNLKRLLAVAVIADDSAFKRDLDADALSFLGGDLNLLSGYEKTLLGVRINFHACKEGD